jgi:diguanylate cyclase (GGDEF)-like protein
MRRLTDPQPVTVTWLGPVRMICLAAAMVTGPVLVTLGPGAEGGLAVVAIGTALLSLLVLTRLYGLVGILARDVAKRKTLEDQLSYQAFHDPLTGLVNRRRFVERAETALAGRQRHGSIAALFLDLDDFKTVNDSLGHVAGDELLVAVAARIRSGLRSTDMAARLGGDEFGILLLDVEDLGYATKVAERLLESIQAPMSVVDTPVEVSASIGITIDTPAMSAVDDLLGDADVAMYQAKALGKGRYHVFTGHPDGATARDRTWTDKSRTVRRPSIGPVSLEPGAG